MGTKIVTPYFSMVLGEVQSDVPGRFPNGVLTPPGLPARAVSWPLPYPRQLQLLEGSLGTDHTAPLERLQLVIDDPITRMPHLPQQHLPAAPRTPQRIMPRTGQHAIAIGLLHHDAIRPLN